MKYCFVVQTVISMHIDVEANDLDSAVEKAQDSSVMSLCHQCASSHEGEWSTSGELDGEPSESVLVEAWIGDRQTNKNERAELDEIWSGGSEIGKTP